MPNVLSLYGFISPYQHPATIDLRDLPHPPLQTLKETGIRCPQRCRQNESHCWQTGYESANSTRSLHPHLLGFTSDRSADPLCHFERSPPPSNQAATFAVTMVNVRQRLDHHPTRLIGS